MRWLSVLVVAVALVAAGCGGGNDESAASTETTTEETTTSSDTTTSDETTTDGSTDTTDLSGILGDEDCLALASVGATMAQAFSGASGSTDDNTAELEALADKVPDEIKADVQVLAQAFADVRRQAQGHRRRGGSDAERAAAPAAPGCDRLVGPGGAHRCLPAHRGVVARRTAPG